jgi:hypothetical protein
VTIDERLECMAHKAALKAALYRDASNEHCADGNFVEALITLRTSALFDHLADVLRAGKTPMEKTNGRSEP